MHVLQVLGFPPDRIGGTEVYVAELARELSALGIESTLVAPRADGEPPLTEHAGLAVETYPVNAEASTDELRRNSPHQGFEVFREILGRHRNAVYHQHSWTRGCGGHHLHAARSLGLPTVLTMHVAGNLCMRGDLMRFGQSQCDGRIDPQTCAACWSQGRGLPAPLAQALSRLPPALSRAARRTGGRLGTALHARAAAEDKQLGAGRMIDDCDRIVAVAGWVEDALIANGAPPGKVALSRQGVSRQFLAEAAGLQQDAAPGETLELVYLGSWSALKGVDIAVRAVRALPAQTPVRLSIHAPSGGPDEQTYEREVRGLAEGDARIAFKGPVDRASLAGTLAAYDALVVPSICLETGPLVVLEAQAAGLFVVGSRLGGIAETVREADAGLLVTPGDVGAWAAAFQSVSERRRAGPLPRHAGAVRNMASVAEEMADLYRRLAA